MHSLSPLLKQMCPTLRVWLDVEQGGGNKPEQAVEESEVFFAFLSKGYLASHTCRKELGKAWKMSKAIVLVRESKSSTDGGVSSFDDLITKKELEEWREDKLHFDENVLAAMDVPSSPAHALHASPSDSTMHTPV